MYNPQTPIAVFVGPSLGKVDIGQVLAANYYPPVQMGDIYRLLGTGVHSIVLIDGVFHRETSIWQREILEALDNNIMVIGASSMGALRAAELHDFGMIGHGVVFAWYRDGIITGDDEVALYHADESGDFRPFSEPLVNIRYTLMQAVRQKYISQSQEADLIDYAQKTYYADRSYPALLNSPVVKKWSQNVQSQLYQFIQEQAVNIKQQDAINALIYCAAVAQAKAEHTSELSAPRHQGRYYGAVRYQHRGFLHPTGDLISGAALLVEVTKDTERVELLRPQLIKEFFLHLLCSQWGIQCPADYLASYQQQWKNDHSNINESQWLGANGLTKREWQTALAERALLAWLFTQSPAFWGLDFEPYLQLLKILLWLSCDREHLAIALSALETKSRQHAKLLRQLTEICYLNAWASTNGIACPPAYVEKFIEKWEESYRISDRSACLQINNMDEKVYIALLANWACCNWLMEKGPAYFGYTVWSFEVALIQELQITGQAAQLVRQIAFKEHEE